MRTSPICLVTGAAGFVGSHLVDRLVDRGWRVIGLDNFLLGRRENVADAVKSGLCTLIEADVNQIESYTAIVRDLAKDSPIDMVWHMAANSDIKAGTTDPDVDLRHTFLTTYNTLKVMRSLGCRSLAFASSSAIYGPHDNELTEDAGPLRPISNYGAMKLASEAVITAALETWLERAWVFRFPNVVGSRATHGVIFDFFRKLRGNPQELEVLGDGRQAKPYLHVRELLDAMLLAWDRASGRFNCFNIGPASGVTTVEYIAKAVVAKVAPNARIRYTGGSQGWPGDVPRFAYSIDRIRSLGWTPKLTSNQAVDLAVDELAAEMRQ
ncbi:MAG: NAD-dependent epimerase/dehydratase family protein [Verrucomicrobia bacterium]|nr:NAD-dependent epimerase/dehydratase family protein [Verrucomicrobiota bacterium]